MKKRIAVYDSGSYAYPSVDTLFRPDTSYPEYMLGELSKTRNTAYEAVRECFRLLELDKEHFGTEFWNPLRDYIKPGDNVLIKPNLVMDVNFNTDAGTECLYTQPGLVAAVIDYVLLALSGSGEVVIGDAPMQECNFENLKTTSGYDCLVKYYQSKGFSVKMVDFRELSTVVKNGVYHSSIKDDAKGTVVQLGKESAFYSAPKEQESRVRITNYDPRILPTHHQGEKQEYYISDYILDADVIINMPKPKTHRKAGVTISLKNFVGANVRKEFLPHHTLGSVEEHGDEYLKKNFIHKMRSHLFDKKNIYSAEKQYKKVQLMRYPIELCSILLKLTGNNYAEGSWYGNHTISRTISDLNKIVIYADKKGIVQETPQRKMFIVADMIVSGDHEGPVAPMPKNVGMVAMGDDPLLFDEAIATLMGFDVEKIPTFKEIRNYTGKCRIYDAKDTAVIVSNRREYDQKEPDNLDKKDYLDYVPTSGWKGHIEKKKDAEE